jgi:hypothetical protein
VAGLLAISLTRDPAPPPAPRARSAPSG